MTHMLIGQQTFKDQTSYFKTQDTEMVELQGISIFFPLTYKTFFAPDHIELKKAVCLKMFTKQVQLTGTYFQYPPFLCWEA